MGDMDLLTARDHLDAIRSELRALALLLDEARCIATPEPVMRGTAAILDGAVERLDWIALVLEGQGGADVQR